MFQKGQDDSLYSFVSRRFGSRIADTLIDPLIRGITAGDAREISVKFMAARPYELEQKYGSVILGSLLSLLTKKSALSASEELVNVGSSKLATAAKSERWSVWSLESGLELLPKRLEQKLVDMGVDIWRNSSVKSLVLDPVYNRNQVHYVDNQTKQICQLECSQIISTIPAWELAKILKESSPTSLQLTQLLSSVPSVDVTVTNLKYTNETFPPDKEGFGFLVPSCEKSVEGLLGIVFNTCAFPQDGDIILTAMSRGISVEKILKYVETTMGFRNPCFVDSVELKDCIPQYTVGHYERIADARKVISDAKLPLTLAGASFDGVSVNDCIMSGRKAGEKLPFDTFRGS